MDALDAIHARQSIGKVRPDPLPRPLIETLLAAGNAAPNHFKVRPWRFIVMTGEGRQVLAEGMARAFQAKFPDAPAEAVAKEKEKPLRAPLLIAVGVDHPSEARVIAEENLCAAAAACQNILLAAQALGLGAIWRTGDAARDPLVRQALGLAADQPIAGFLYIGYPEIMPEKKARPEAEDRTTWLESAPTAAAR